MPDWRRLVARRLRRATLPPPRRDEIERELAGFLEDRYEDQLSDSRRPRAAAREAIASAGGWPELRRGIEEVEMGSRVKTLWIPGFVIALAALLLSRLPHAQWGGVSILRLPQMLVLVWSWLLMLPFVSALGAEWSRRQGGGRREQVLVALSPAFAMLVVFAVAFVLTGRPASQFPERGAIPGRVMFFVNFVLVPTVPTLLGCLPALTRRSA